MFKIPIAELKEKIIASGNIDSLALEEKIKANLNGRGIPSDHPVYKILSVDIAVCSMGLIDYMQKTNLLKKIK